MYLFRGIDLEQNSIIKQQYEPKLWFIIVLCCVIDFDKGMTLLINQCLAERRFSFLLNAAS